MAEVERIRASRPDAVVFAITLQPNRDPSGVGFDEHEMREASRLHYFAAVMDRHHLGLGPRYRRMHRLRTAYVMLAQRGVFDTPHWHGLAFVEASKAGLFYARAGPAWRTLTHGGSLHLEANPDAGWIGYATRHLDKRPEDFALHVLPELRRPR